MELIMEDSDLQSKAKERWTSQIPSILEQAKLEAERHTGRLSAFFKQDADGKY